MSFLIFSADEDPLQPARAVLAAAMNTSHRTTSRLGQTDTGTYWSAQFAPMLVATQPVLPVAAGAEQAPGTRHRV